MSTQPCSEACPLPLVLVSSSHSPMRAAGGRRGASLQLLETSLCHREGNLALATALVETQRGFQRIPQNTDPATLPKSVLD